MENILCGPLRLCVLCVSLTTSAAAVPREFPNIVVFFSDDHGQLDSTVYGATDVRTPNMQRLAEAGMTFTHAFVASPACAPSRGAMLTGLMPSRNGAEANHTFPREDIKPLPAYLRELGYDVAAFGKVAHGKGAERFGFDHVDPNHESALVRDYLDRRQSPDRPVCLMVGTHSPHVPWPEEHNYDPDKLSLPPTFVDTPETRNMRARYCESVTTADRELGDIYALAREMFAENVLFIYTSDHGAQWPFGKWNLYDAGTRVPFIAAWEGVIQPGTRSESMISWIDLLPTFIEIAGGEAPPDIDGRSFLQVLQGAKDSHRDRVFTTHSGDGRMNVYPMRSVRTREWKYVLNLHPEFAYTTHIDQAQGKDGLLYWLPWRAKAEADQEAAAIVDRYHRRPREELYDLSRDPYEQQNLAEHPEHTGRLTAFRAEVEEWMKAQGDGGTVFQEPRLLANPDDWAPSSQMEAGSEKRAGRKNGPGVRDGGNQ